MGTLFRSEEMQLVQLFFQLEAAHDTIDELGELGIIQFKDLNPKVNLFQRSFVTELRRADEMERKVRSFDTEIKNFAKHAKSEDVEKVFVLNEDEDGDTAIPPVGDIDELENRLEELEKEMQQMNSNEEMLKRNYNELVELQHVLTKNEEFFRSSSRGAVNVEEDDEAPLMEEGAIPMVDPRTGRLGFITGTIQRKHMSRFERLLWRVTRGNIFMKHMPLEEAIVDPREGTPLEKDVFLVFFQGNRAQEKIVKICESFGANRYHCPENSDERGELMSRLDARLQDLGVVLNRSKEHKERLLRHILLNMSTWKSKVLKEKSIYTVMNMCNFDVGRKCLIAEGWCPTNATGAVQRALDTATERSGALVPSILNIIEPRDEPPTFFRTNRFTASFQSIVDAYGIASYREVNPGLFTIITFPFTFALMFGDMGHGFIMFLFALYMVLQEKQLGKIQLNEMIRMCFDGRYMLLLMGLFSIYTGIIYNECFAIPFDIFGTRWRFDNEEDHLTGQWTNPATAYPFGVDPVWKGSANELIYYNSLKMKLSIIFGVTHMVFGIILSLFNGVYFKRPYNIWFEFVPQICFMLSIFGYMCFLIFRKWSIDFVSEGREAPQLLNLMINMFLTPTSLPAEHELFSGQLYVQWLLIIIAAISVPMMLLPKPLLLLRDHKRTYQTLGAPHHHDHEASVGHADDEEEEEEFDFSEIIVHQTIHTIEFVLGAISNTASYLRLWALSLAHSELSTVFWERVFVATMGQGSFIAIFCGFAVWATMTAAVLLVMEALSAFLHALRLHWVEFQNKFYQGTGYLFVPFSFERILSESEAEQ